jgi:diaminohydroxyphosphoribosylaminopyrimidine deaminase/5-amino-6-(5-phosphoribosylamino)uracil reductase
MNDLNLAPSAKQAFMRQAIGLARLGLGLTAPNPCVGAVITHKGQVVAEGYHAAFGAPHAEVQAISQAQDQGLPLSECTLWVTLEPCNHQGKTPPCTQAILEARIPAVGIGTLDPNDQVSGGGARYLKDHGVEVEVGILEQACQDLIADFVLWQTQGRPFVLLKLAASLDGKIAARHGQPTRLSSRQSRREVHLLRGRSQAVLIGGGTLRADNPRLTCREGKPKNQPLAIVVSTRLPKTDQGLYLLRNRPEQTLFWTTPAQAETEQASSLRALGCRVWGLPMEGQGRIDLGSGLSRFFAAGLGHYLLCEGGAHLAMYLVNRRLADCLRVYQAPKILGNDQALCMFAGPQSPMLSTPATWRYTSVRQVGPDLCLELRPS